MIWVVGDVHGEIPVYEGILQKIHQEEPEAITFQVGDMGLGFKGVRYPNVGPNDFWISGNHDDALVCEKCPGYLGDYGVKEIAGERIFFMRGAESYDKALRQDGVDWWAYEELSYPEMMEASKLYRDSQPTVVITHDGPDPARMAWFPHCGTSRTSQCLTQMFADHQPYYWCFGHHHRPRYGSMGGTYFMCIETLAYKEVQQQTATAWLEEEEAYERRKLQE